MNVIFGRHPLVISTNPYILGLSRLLALGMKLFIAVYNPLEITMCFPMVIGRIDTGKVCV